MEIAWKGNLNDDCKAEWNGLYLHAEQMDRNYWWWAVSDSNHGILISSNDMDEEFKSGKAARLGAELAAKNHVSKLQKN